MNTITDQFNRPLQDVRVSVIDRCNFRCQYCMPAQPEKEYAFLAKREWLTGEEILRLARVLLTCGVQKVRLTGGEPLLRPDIPDLVRNLNALTPAPDIALTTNGSLLSRYAGQLKAAGLSRLTVSLDTLDSRIFRDMGGTQTPLTTVLDGISAARDSGIASIKINVVIQKGVNDGSILDLVDYFRGTGCILRFIEYMDVGTCNHWDRRYVVPSAKILTLIDRRYPLQALDRNYFGEVAERYAYRDGQGEIGFISSVSQPFCRSCTRLRITTDGRLVTCLFAEGGVNLRDELRGGATDNRLRELIGQTWQGRSDRYSELRAGPGADQNTQKKLEMYQIGG
ncbi:MAG: GTP 3',8-cyclase MoaA [Candidatus Omnitrophica bacterium]|nr:GTP 3',8-cyclase MoaA [Candidatus Omnitrophota bacterium]MCB9721852.1 GTP 3',8-cyclase MoaA [Candidatus Omnitrophota bacterium]